MRRPSVSILEYIKRLAEGDDPSAIARSRNLAPYSVKNNLGRLYASYNVNSAHGMVVLSIRNKWLTDYDTPEIVKQPSEKAIDIIRYLANGYSVDDIALEHGIMPTTVKFYLKQMYKDNKISNMSQLVAVALKEGWIK